jgi:hypothetical protein
MGRRRPSGGVLKMGKKMLLAMAVGAVVAVAALAVGAMVLYSRSKKVPDKLEAFGPFEVVTHTLRFMTGWNEGPLATDTTENYSLRYRAEPFVFEGKAGMSGDQTRRYDTFNAVLTFPSPEPAIVVNVGDPNNSSFYYLIREESGKAVAQYLGPSSGGVSAEWLDPPADKAPSEKSLGLHRGRLEGGRWLLLGEYSVLDTRSLKGYKLHRPEGICLNQVKPTIAMAPDGGSFVRFGCSMDSSNAPMLGVFEIETESAYTLRIDRARMRYNDLLEIDAAWLDHHFEWKRAEDGRLRLLERAGFEPLPYHGTFAYAPPDQYREYKLPGVKPQMRDRLIAFLENEYQAKLQPRGEVEASDALLIGQNKVNVMLYEGSVAVWLDRGSDIRLLEDIAKKFDEVLRTGELDSLFVLPPTEG